MQMTWIVQGLHRRRTGLALHLRPSALNECQILVLVSLHSAVQADRDFHPHAPAVRLVEFPYLRLLVAHGLPIMVFGCARTPGQSSWGPCAVRFSQGHTKALRGSGAGAWVVGPAPSPATSDGLLTASDGVAGLAACPRWRSLTFLILLPVESRGHDAAGLIVGEAILHQPGDHRPQDLPHLVDVVGQLRVVDHHFSFWMGGTSAGCEPSPRPVATAAVS